MQAYKIYHLRNEGSIAPLEIKLNLKDGFVRLCGPQHEVLKFQRKPAFPSQATVNNGYGAPLFLLRQIGDRSDHFLISLSGNKQVRVQFTNDTEMVATLEMQASNNSSNAMRFALEETEAATELGIREMLAAAACMRIMHLTFAQQNLQRKAVA
jgi:hypothetical protein